ncbi:MAG: hypothetical protein AAFO82_16010, partial [Bacteroidota bacterium]
MVRLLKRWILIVVSSNTIVYAQQIGYTTFHPQPEEEPRIQAIELDLAIYNELFMKNGEPLRSTDPMVTEDHTVWIYHEVQCPEEDEKEGPIELSVPFKQESLFQADNTLNYEQFNEFLTGTTINGLSFQTDANTSGFYHIPPDPSGAVGTTHVCHVVNTSIHCHTKEGVAASGFPQSMSTFFSSLSPQNVGFDPKILWDQYENRFVVVNLILEATSSGDPANVSRVLIAVSEGADPTGTWHFQAIDAAQTINSTESWFDYPGFAVDEEAVYITGNYFTFSNNASIGQRLIIIDKGVSGGIYDGTTSADENPATNSNFNLIDPNPPFVMTLQPAHIFGISPSGSIGTWLVGYSGLTNSVQDFLQVGQINDPLGTPTFSWDNVSMGDVDNNNAIMVNAPQSGNVNTIETNDRRTLNAVWRDNALWVTTTVVPGTGANTGEATALWAKLNEDGVNIPTVEFTGEVGGEDIAAGSSTYMASIAVNSVGDAAVG